jgi:hypothetical protein
MTFNDRRLLLTGSATQLKSFLSSRIGRGLEALLIFSVVLAVCGRAIGEVEFHPDESDWIYTSAYFEVLMTQGWTSPLWGEFYWTLTQPPLTRYLIALGRRAGGYRVADLNQSWDFTVDRATNIALGNMPDPGLLWWSRLPMAILAAFSGLGLFLIVSTAVNRVAGYTLVGLFLINNPLLTMLCRAMGEAPLLTGVTFVILAGIAACQNWYTQALGAYPSFKVWLPAFMRFVGIGIASGLAGAAKLNGLFSAVAGVGLCVLSVLGHKGSLPRPARLTFAIRTSVALCLAAELIFVALNPFLYPDPFTRTGKMFKFRAQAMQAQAALYPTTRIEGLGARITIVGSRIFQDYAAFRFPLAWGINLWLTLLGLAWLLRDAWRGLRQAGQVRPSAVILLVGAVVAIPSLFTPLDWDRYYLLPIVFCLICLAIGIGESLTLLTQWGGRALATWRGSHLKPSTSESME